MMKFMQCVVLVAGLTTPHLLSAETIGVWPEQGTTHRRHHVDDRSGRHGLGDTPMVAPPVVVGPRHGATPEPRWFRDRHGVPSACLRRFATRYGQQEIFGTRCLQNWPRLTSSLPDSCHVRIMTRVGVRDGYDPDCLRSQGYRSRY